MQVTIVQDDIHEAIRNFILEQIDVKPGMRIDVTLKATRGEDGTTAIIDIRKDDGSKTDTKAVSNETAAPAPVTSTSSKAAVIPATKPENEPDTNPVEKPAVTPAKPTPKPSGPKAAPKPAPVAEAPKEEAVAEEQAEVLEEAAKVDAADVAEAEPEAGSEEALASEAAATEPTEEVEETEAAPVRQSLFAGLKSNPK